MLSALIVPDSYRVALDSALREIRVHLVDGIIPFWATRTLDHDHGGYFTHFDEHGRHEGTPEKYLNTQCRLLWWFSTLARVGVDREAMLERARLGYQFIEHYLWDARHGGWYWKCQRDGSEPDQGKVIYGQCFAIYALSTYAIASQNKSVLAKATATFELLQVNATDTLNGGYFENLERDWQPSQSGFHAGDRKSLDTHMHLMEAYCALTEATGQDTHRRKLIEIMRTICRHMLDPHSGCGRNQFDHAFRPIPAIAIRRTWNAERQGEAPASPTDTTSYGHNVELSWLMHWAVDVARCEKSEFSPHCERLLEHALQHGVDWELGGVYRDGTNTGPALVLEKEFWQNAESLVGFLDGFERIGNPRYLDAFLNIWKFSRDHFLAPCGEWRILLDRQGRPLDSHVGNDWKTSYHTGRAILECRRRLEALLSRDSD